MHRDTLDCYLVSLALYPFPMYGVCVHVRFSCLCPGLGPCPSVSMSASVPLSVSLLCPCSMFMKHGQAAWRHGHPAWTWIWSLENGHAVGTCTCRLTHTCSLFIGYAAWTLNRYHRHVRWYDIYMDIYLDMIKEVDVDMDTYYYWTSESDRFCC
jgi:hypothetical protein